MIRAPWLLVLCALSALNAQERVLVPFDRPLNSGWGPWVGTVPLEDGRLPVRGAGVTAKGGVGVNLPAPLNLRDAAELCPVVALRVGAANQMKGLRLILRDKQGREADYDYTLPPAGDALVVVYPRDGAVLGQPNATGQGGSAPDLGQVAQWVVAGDHLDAKVVDVLVERLALVPPTPAMVAQRQAREAAERERRRREAEALRARYGRRSPNSPSVEHVGLVAPDVVAVTIAAGRVVPGKLEPYRPAEGDQRLERRDPNGHGQQLILKRGGQELGWLIGPRRDQLIYFEQLVGDPLLTDLADQPATWQVTAADDPAFARPVVPTAVWRKTGPTDWAQPGRGFALRHSLYLKLPTPLTAGRTYSVAVGELNVRTPTIQLVCDPVQVRSEAVHVSQLGYRPDDEPKRAFVSCWLGTGGALRYPAGLKFQVVDAATGQSVFSGAAELAVAAETIEPLVRKDNFSKTDVYRLDFSALRTPGRYRVAVDGVGCSYPFEIGRDVWQRAFVTQMWGLYHQRSGVELGPPYTTFRKPRDFHPADGVKVYQSTHSQLDGGSEWDLAKHATTELVPDAWGGYHDAGDWNPRRVTHMKTTLAQLELLDLFPDYFRTLTWNIPRATQAPAILEEALFEVDCFRRLQKPDGGVPFGIESPSDPIDGEVSWLQTMPAYVYAPDVGSSCYYASVAARVAKLLAPTDPELARTYRESALRAMAWAERDWAARKAAGTLAKLPWEVSDWRNLAALILYDLTGDRHWHDVFLEDTLLTKPGVWLKQWGRHIQCDAAFAYARLKPELADAKLRANAVAAIEMQASAARWYAKGNAFNLTTPDSGRPLFAGFYSTPDAIELVRAHYLTHNRAYLTAAVQACGFGGGANPNNLCYTTGLGANPVQHPLHLDSRRTGQPAPAGLTTFGNVDFVSMNQTWLTWPLTYHLGKLCVPSAWDWPANEAYWDIFLFVGENEFVIDTWAPTVYVWGYLAARP